MRPLPKSGFQQLGSALHRDAEPKVWANLFQAMERVLRVSMGHLLTRSQRRGSTGWLDTKIDLQRGEPSDPSDPLRGHGVVYGWAQGRALEALARHGRWWETFPQDQQARDLAQQTKLVLRALLGRLNVARSTFGRLTFLMDHEGRALTWQNGDVSPAPQRHEDLTLTSLFEAKGLIEAGAWLNDAPTLERGLEQLRGVIEAVRDGRFVVDQLQLDPANPVRPVVGRHPQAPWMLSVAAAARVATLLDDTPWSKTADDLADHLRVRHVCEVPSDDFRRGDLWEFTDGEGKPYVNASDQVPSDPGHAIELSGFCLTHLAQHTTPSAQNLTSLQRLWTEVALRSFADGWNGIGICKALDLRTRRPINPQLPWWPLPEAMRTASVAMESADAHTRDALIDMFCRSAASFFARFLQPQWGMAYPCLEADGTIANAIPAIPDADPGYHTNLCFIDVLSQSRRHGWPRGCVDTSGA